MPFVITLRTEKSKVACRIRSSVKLQELAMKWSYTVRHRNRWISSAVDRIKVADDARADLQKIGVSVKHLRTFANAKLVEVSVPYKHEEVGWEARIMPWEYLLSAATQSFRKGHLLTVIRHLNLGDKRIARPPKPGRLAIIEAAPGILQHDFDFANEKSMVQGTLHELETMVIDNPTRETLTDGLRRFGPQIIHLTGIDTRLGNRLLNKNETTDDGIYLSHPSGGMDIVEANELAVLLNSGQRSPDFIGFNCWDSGARMAPLAVAHGARNALGFENTFDDSIAEKFFLHFYRACATNEWNYLDAFRSAWEGISSYRHRIHGSGIILWSAQSLVAALVPQNRRESVITTGKAEVNKALRADPKHHRIAEIVAVTVEVADCLNYASLHNQGSYLKQAGLMKKLLLHFLPQSQPSSAGGEPFEESVRLVEDIEIKVQLNVGTDSFPYLSKVSIAEEDGVIDLASIDPKVAPIRNNPSGGVRVPLTSELARSVDERMQTTVLVEVRWHEQLLHRHTYPLWLNPVDEWRLSNEEIVWLPSFVQPRDPAIHTIIDKSQQYLRCLADYSAAGFGGYQAYNPEARGLRKWDGVDEQVRAIWTTIAFETRLHYINPPPSYSENTQRLRAPHQTVRQGRGTCVDLAILLASCLEWIEIYPVIFMLDDHAFPGYWKSLEAYERFRVPTGVNEQSTAGGSLVNSERNEDAPGWIAPRDSYLEIRKYIHDGTLVPLETVGLTSGDSFSDAKANAFEYFQNLRHRTFHSMVDIVRSRTSVTPLPLLLNDDHGG